jgi:serine/threonine protein kinase
MSHIEISRYFLLTQPENLLLTSNNPEGLLKLADFGISKIMSDEMLTTNCGTPVYMAPEIWAGQAYDNKVDVWSVGVVMYYLLSGEHPFMGDSDTIAERIMMNELSFQNKIWNQISSKGTVFPR